MNFFEEELTKALRRKDPPPGFEEKVLSRIAVPATPRLGLWQRVRSRLEIPPRPLIRLASVGMMAALLISIGVMHYYHEKRVKEGEMAKSQVMLALQIASNRLNHAQKAVLEKVNQPPVRN